jgi:hypothetical protein
MSDLGLGPCCICGGTRRVRNILMLSKKAPVPGHGWGCLACGLPADGASVVVCDRCCRLHSSDIVAACRYACRGYPATDGRVPIGELTGTHEHDMAKHPEHNPLRN